MKSNNHLTLSTSPLSQPARKPRKTAILTRRQRLLYGRKRPPTVKERDSETGLYYYGARYLDSRTSRWLSGDPAMGEYVPEAPVNDEARKRNQNIPGMGGVFNYVNLHVYHYAGNNPVRLVDPKGRDIEAADSNKQEQILKTINASSYNQYEFNEKGKLEKTDGTNEKGSKELSNVIDEGIASNKVIKIHWYNKSDKKPENAERTHTRQPPKNATTINIYIVDSDEKYPMQDGSTRALPMARKLMHELAGHAVPWATRAPNVQNAINIENNIINSLHHQLHGEDAPLDLMRRIEDDPSYIPYF